MKKVAVMLAEGFEEGESMLVIDIMRRAGFLCNGISLGDDYVKGSHNIVVKADAKIQDGLEDYDMIVLPGGLPGATNLRDSADVIHWVQEFNEIDGKYVAAICAAPMVLKEAGIVKGRTLTSYPADKYREMFKESDYREETVVIDGELITSRGPATTFPFAFTLVDVLGGNSSEIKNKMLYHLL